MQPFTCIAGDDPATQGQCPAGYVEASPQVFVAMDASLPDADLAASVFALGFIAAFSTARVMAMVIRAVIQLVKF